MAANKDRLLPILFIGYAILTGSLFLFLPRLLGQRILMPWDYWWLFLFVTPPLVAIVLGRHVPSGRFTWLGVVMFVLAALALGLFYGWFSHELSGVV